eukprot:9437251-Alexandrium_andersonii.AAC.1
MSASLVGSEMCIRDSLCQQSGVDFVPMVAEASGAWAPDASRVLQQLAPVSYTHLTLPTICSV